MQNFFSFKVRSIQPVNMFINNINIDNFVFFYGNTSLKFIYQLFTNERKYFFQKIRYIMKLINLTNLSSFSLKMETSQSNLENEQDILYLVRWRGYEDRVKTRGEMQQLSIDRFEYELEPFFQTHQYYLSRKRSKQSVWRMINELLSTQRLEEKLLTIATEKIEHQQQQPSITPESVQSIRQRNPLRNLFQDARKIFLKYLQKYVPEYFESNQKIKCLRDSKSSSKKIYLNLFTDPTLRQALIRIFDQKLLQKQFQRSKHSEEIKKAYLANAHVFEQAFINQRFDKISIHHLQQSQSDQQYSTQTVSLSSNTIK